MKRAEDSFGSTRMNTPTILEPNEIKTSPRPDTAAPPPKPKSRWWLWLLILAVLGYGGYLVFRSLSKTAAPAPGPRGASMAGRSVPVVAAAAQRGNLPVYLRGLGSVTAFNTVTVRSRVDGQLIRVAFQEGQFVKQGDLLAEIDPRPYEVQLAQAQGQMERDVAQMNDAKVNLSRYEALYAEKVIAKQQLDTQKAAVDQFQGALVADQSQIDSAKLQLTYSKITAPISGRVGLRLVDQGNMIRSSDVNGLVVITQVQPIAVLFTIPADNLPPVLKKLRGQSRLPVDAFDRAGSTKLATGYLLTLDNQIDQTTGTSRLKAVFENRDHILFPNQFVNIRLLLDTKKNVVTIPTAAIQRGPSGTFVYAVKSDKTVEVRPITAGISEGNSTEVDAGLAEGDLVVTDGQEKLKDGSKVDVRSPRKENSSSSKTGRGPAA